MSKNIIIIFLVKKQLAVNSTVLSRESIQIIKALQEGLGGIRDVLIDGTQGTYGKFFKKNLKAGDYIKANDVDDK